MDFFRSQEDAHRRTRVLLGLFALSVLSIIVLLYVLFGIISKWEGGWWNPQLLLWTAGGTVALVFCGSAWKTMQLSGDGGVVARELGGRQLHPDTQDPDERKLLNVVEEMALASGVPVPEVWVLDREESINAFASGHTPADAAIGVTRGCIRTLTRSELQGVIAHEFSHILNGDMRLNLRLMGLVHGILIIALLGEIVLRTGNSGRSSKDKGGVVAFGMALFAIGYLGVFFSRLIKSAISRQREFLADASAVQFTRHPESIGGALIKIGGIASGSRLKAPLAAEASHMMFGNALHESAVKWFATHPPLEERIRAVMPAWDGKFPKVSLAAIRTNRPHDPRMSAFAGTPPPLPDRQAAATAISRIGNITSGEIEAARELVASIPDWLRAQLHDTDGAQAAVFSVILSAEAGGDAAETQALAALVDEGTCQTTLRVAQEVRDWHSSRLIALIDLAIPALRRLTPPEYDRFTAILDELIRSDQKIDLFEFMLQKIVRRHLDQYFRRVPPVPVRFASWEPVAEDIGILLSAMADLGQRDPRARSAAMEAGIGRLHLDGYPVNPSLVPDAGLERISTALDRIDQAAPAIKKSLLYACSAVALHDDQLASDEAELLRAIADTIGCPLPPFVLAHHQTPG